MLRAVESGAQAAFMAPTETLAEQHMATIDRLLGGHVPVGLLTGATPARGGARSCSTGSASGELGMIVGTHALIEPAVEFRALGARRGGRAAPLRRAPARRARREGRAKGSCRTRST